MSNIDQINRLNNLRNVLRTVEPHKTETERMKYMREFHPERACHLAWIAREMARVAKAAEAAAEVFHQACIDQAMDDGRNAEQAQILYEQIVSRPRED